MAKTQEELNALKAEVETVSKERQKLTEEELAQVTGGVLPDGNKPDGVLPGNEIGITGEENNLVGARPAL